MSTSESRAQVSERLTGGLTLLTAAVAVTAAYKDALARTSINYGGTLFIAVILTLLGIALAVISWAVAGRRRVWGFLAAASMVFTACGILLALRLVLLASNSYDRPQVSAEYDGSALSFTGQIDLMKATETLTVSVYGYPARIIEPLPRGYRGEDRGSELYFATSGPGTDGSGHVSGKVPLTPSAYELVEVRVYLSSNDPGCQRTDPDAKKPAACTTVWLQPRPPVLAPAR